MANQELRFRFGKNWLSFVEHAFDSQRLVQAGKSLQSLLGIENLVGKTILDIGCGSGMFSLAACMLGASHVMGFDYDSDSVSASTQLRTRAGISASRWQICQGDVLNSAFVEQLETADIVYSWGVLHHTGDMWRAIELAASRVRMHGQLVIAIYNRVDHPIIGSRMWWRVKWLYNKAPGVLRFAMEIAYVILALTQQIIRGQNPIAFVTQLGRGMDFWHDVRDWMGGFPYEYASVTELSDYLEQRGFQIQLVREIQGPGCNELVFQRVA